MFPGDQKNGNLREKLQLLRSVTNSQAVSKASIIVDASRYIEELKHKVQRLNEDIAINSSNGQSLSLSDEGPLHKVTVQKLDRGFVINVYSEKSSPGLLVSILEAFEDLGLVVLEARVSCTDTFHLEAVGGEQNDGQAGESVDAHMVKRAVMEAIKKSRETNGG